MICKLPVLILHIFKTVIRERLVFKAWFLDAFFLVFLFQLDMKDKNMSSSTKFQSSSRDLQITSPDFTHF